MSRRAIADPTKPLNEARWQTVVLRYARQFGWLSYHTLNSWGSAKGFPDLVLARPPRLLFVELKSDKGAIKDEQRVWLHQLTLCGVEAYLWRPSDVETVVEVLASRDGPLAAALETGRVA